MGRKAFKSIKNFQPDIVTFRYYFMPEWTGLRSIKRNLLNWISSAKVLFVSAMEQQGMVLDAIKGGAKDLIVNAIPNDRVIERFKQKYHS